MTEGSSRLHGAPSCEAFYCRCSCKVDVSSPPHLTTTATTTTTTTLSHGKEHPQYSLSLPLSLCRPCTETPCSLTRTIFQVPIDDQPGFSRQFPLMIH
ncbi:hypothetical protein E2C01_059836 [Portunus trituberculatus]|uniref:Uncharacterized protein n=1 Tax=Portunus trituberculatus TaxID=210409 RepID=A0A5B7GZI1_PORTR|nr:hypothetical protein [Portunus trituberculatus]